MFELKELSLEDEVEIYEMLQEIGPGENGFENRGYFVEYKNFQDYLKGNLEMSKGLNLMKDCVPQTIYWLFKDEKPIGVGKLRHYLNENLMKTGGHIGYCIRPGKRGFGYGNLILSQLLKKAKECGMNKILVTCTKENLASRKVIEKNKGVLKDIKDNICRYWIYNM